MLLKPRSYLRILLFSLFPLSLHAQSVSPSDSTIQIEYPSGKKLDKLSNHFSRAEAGLISTSEKSIKKLKKWESKIYKKLKRNAGNKGQEFVWDSLDYNLLSEAINGKNSLGALRKKAGEYFPNLDSVQTSLAFLHGVNPSPAISSLLNQSKVLTERLKLITAVQEKLKQRLDFLKNKYKLFGLGKEFSKLQKDLYYYNARIKELKAQLNDPKQLQITAFRYLSRLKGFQKFMEDNSYLASVFGGNLLNQRFSGLGASSIPDLPGLQTVASVNNTIGPAMSSVDLSGRGVSGGDPLTNRLAEIRNELQNIKSTSGDWDDKDVMPDFKPNEMRSKSFFDRLEWGTNFQFRRNNYRLPSMLDVGLQVSYRLHQNSSVGVGMSYKLGYGTLQRVQFSHEGVGLRSFLDFKLKGNIYINGGFEFNYLSGFKTIEELKNFSAWQGSALIGLSKKYKLGGKTRGNFHVLYDFLHNQHTPRTSPVLFRFGYQFK